VKSRGGWRTAQFDCPPPTMSILFQRARASGVCPPSLLSELGSTLDSADGFDLSMSRVLDGTGRSLFLWDVYMTRCMANCFHSR
jgi:hypothetical protein